ncbi:MAG: hypothetical protein JOY81_05890 [Alphaproteobacteria bacterium]|nr:hypothetical protein [Alphaproteobacteria bacterium]
MALSAVPLSDGAKSFLLAAVSTILAAIVGIWVVAYWTVWPAAMSSQGDSMIVYDPEIGMVANRGAHTRRVYPAIGERQHFEYDVYTDDRGARVDGPSLRSPAHVDIVSLGDSFAWAHGLQNPQSYTSLVGRDLGMSTSNFALAAYGSQESLQVLRRNRDLKPRLVIHEVIAHHYWRNVSPCAPSYYAFCLDVSHVAFDPQGKPFIAPPRSNGVYRLETHMRRDWGNPVRWLAHGADVISGRVYQALAEGHMPDDKGQAAAMAYLLKEMKRTTDEMGAELVIVFLTTNYYGPPETLPGIVQSLGLRYLDTTEAFHRHRDAGKPSPYIPGDGHPNAIGHALIAHEIEDYLKRERLAP